MAKLNKTSIEVIKRRKGSALIINGQKINGLTDLNVTLSQSEGYMPEVTISFTTILSDLKITEEEMDNG